MNQRIRQLALEAFQPINDITTEGVADRRTFDQAWFQHYNEKFAELIVQECLNEIQSLLDCNTQVDEFEQGVYNGLDMAKDCIKEHFGVEE